MERSRCLSAAVCALSNSCLVDPQGGRGVDFHGAQAGYEGGGYGGGDQD